MVSQPVLVIKDLLYRNCCLSYQGTLYLASPNQHFQCQPTRKFENSASQAHKLRSSCPQHGESEFNVLGKIGGNAVLSARGERYAQALATKINSMRIPELRVLTSRLRRTIATARGIEAPQEHVAALNELHAGVCEGLSYEEMQEQYPQVSM